MCLLKPAYVLTILSSLLVCVYSAAQILPGTLLTAQTSPSPLAYGNLTIADLNDDGLPDMIVQPSYDFFSVLLNRGHGTFTKGVEHALPTPSLLFSTADLNGDGHVDLIFVSSYHVTVLPGNGDGSFGPRIDSTKCSGDPGYPVIGDFTGDGIPDLAINSIGIYETNNFSILTGRGDGSFVNGACRRLEIGIVATADLNGDGVLDLVGGANHGLKVF